MACSDRITTLCNITGQNAYPDFSGTMCYETTFQWDGRPGELAVLDCGLVYETLEVLFKWRETGCMYCATVPLPPARTAEWRKHLAARCRQYPGPCTQGSPVVYNADRTKRFVWAGCDTIMKGAI